MTQAITTERLRTVALAMMACWATLLSLESWFRSPGVDQPHPFPAELLHQGERYTRTGAAPDAERLPGDLVALASADYQAQGRPRLALRWLTLPSSGRGITFPLEQVGAAVLGPGATGFCQRTTRPGSGAPRLHTDAQLRTVLKATAPKGWDRLVWVAGLRPYQNNACLWTGWRESSEATGRPLRGPRNSDAGRRDADGHGPGGPGAG
jgi:hypothetical protein